MTETRPLRVLFLAMSRNQEKHFRALAEQMPVESRIVNAKHPGRGPLIKSLSWLWRHRKRLPVWLQFRLQKGQLNNGSSGGAFQLGLALRIAHMMSGVLGTTSKWHPEVLFLLNGAHYKQQAAIHWAREQGIKIAYLELGFLPNTMALDGAGVNYANSIPRDASFYRQYRPQGHPVDANLVRRPPRKAVGEPITLPKHYLFVPFQVYDDTQILVHSPWVKSMEALYQLLEETLGTLPDDYVYVVKEHPTSKKAYSHLHERHPRIWFANANDTQQLIDHSQGVITINSTVGIESLLLGRPVITLGNACYNINDLVAHADNVTVLREWVANPKNLPFDAKLVRHFVAWLKEQYLIEGRWPDYEEQYPKQMRRRLEQILTGAPF